MTPFFLCVCMVICITALSNETLLLTKKYTNLRSINKNNIKKSNWSEFHRILTVGTLCMHFISFKNLYKSESTPLVLLFKSLNCGRRSTSKLWLIDSSRSHGGKLKKKNPKKKNEKKKFFLNFHANFTNYDKQINRTLQTMTNK